MGKTRETANLVSTNNLFVDITNERVGVGTNLPTSTLEVNGNANVSGIITATTFVGNLTGNAQGLTGNPSIIVTNINASGITTSTTIEDSKGEVRTIPQSTNTTIVASDAGKYVSVATTITINSSTGFSVGEAVTIFNNSASQIGINTGTVTMYQAGTANTGVRTLDQRGLATILCVGTDTYVISGAGLA